MKLTGLITEYNPFHNGHLHHLEESKRVTEATHTVAVMSGHFLQRGEVALFDKWSRAKAAVLSGVDLVVELPSLYACASAEYFARGATLALNALQCDALCFGSEAGEINPIANIALALSQESDDFKTELKGHLKSGLSYPVARERALKSASPNDLPYTANNILGIEYLKALYWSKSSIKPYTIKRICAPYHAAELSGAISSATSIRKAIHQSGATLADIAHAVPQHTFNVLIDYEQHYLFAKPESVYPYIRYQLLSESSADLSNTHELSVDLVCRLKLALKDASDLNSLILLAKSKHYTYTRIQRALTNLLLKRKTRDVLPRISETEAPYLRILAFNQKGRDIIRQVNKHSPVPFLNNPSRFKAWSKTRKDFFNADVQSTEIFHLVQGHRLSGEDYLRQPVEVE